MLLICSIITCIYYYCWVIWLYGYMVNLTSHSLFFNFLYSLLNKLSNMRIAILADPIDNQSAGIHHYTRGLIEGLGAIDPENEYLIIRQKVDPDFEKLQKKIVNNYPNLPGYKALRMFLILPFMLKKWKVDVVVEPAHFGPFNLPKLIKRVTVIHDLTPVLFPGYHRWHSQILQRIFLKGILKRASMIITNSAHTKKDVLNYYPEGQNKTHFIHLGTNPAFKPDHHESVLTKFGIKKPYFISLGTIEPRKNFSTLLDAFEILCRKTEGSEQPYLVFCGQKGWKSRPFYQKLARHPYKGRIIITGYTTSHELPALLTHARALLMPSFYEGFGMPITEAMSCGTPSIVSNTSSLPEVGRDACLTCDPGNPAEWSEKMHRILTDEQLAQELSSKALIRKDLFSWKDHARQFDELMNNLV